MSVRIYAGLVAATTAYAVLLQRLKRRLEPNWTWLEVAVGTAIVLGFAHLQRRNKPSATASEFERIAWVSFFIGGIPIVIWQVWQRLTDLQEAISESKWNGVVNGKPSEELAKRGR